MKLKSLRLGNYKVFKQTEINFSERVTGIIGSGGSGKSTLLEAIKVAFSGIVRPAENSLRNHRATVNDAVMIELSFEHEGMLHRVVRNFEGESLLASVHLFAGEKLLTAIPYEVQEELTRICQFEFLGFDARFIGFESEAFDKYMAAMMSLPFDERLSERGRHELQQELNEIAKSATQLIKDCELGIEFVNNLNAATLSALPLKEKVLIALCVCMNMKRKRLAGNGITDPGFLLLEDQTGNLLGLPEQLLSKVIAALGKWFGQVLVPCRYDRLASVFPDHIHIVQKDGCSRLQQEPE